MLFLFWLFFAIAIGIFAERAGRSFILYGLLSLVLSPLVAGIILLCVGNAPSKTKAPAAVPTVRCPHCTEIVRVGARVCPHCTRDLFDQVSSAPTRRKAKGFYYHANGVSEGPFTQEDLGAFYDAGTIDDETPVCREGDEDWKPFSTFKEFA